MAVRGYEGPVEVFRDGTAIVYRAWQPAFSRHVAVHVFPGMALERLEVDARRTAALAGHPNVVTVHEFGATGDGVSYMVTESLDDGPLSERLRRDGPLAWDEALQVTIKVAGVLETVGRAGVATPEITARDVWQSRFGDHKVLMVGCAEPTEAGDVSGLRSLLQDLTGGGEVNGCQAEGQGVLRGAARDTAAFIRQLQQAERDAGLPVTELPAATMVGGVVPALRDEGFSQAVTALPLSPAATTSGGRRRNWRPPLVVAACLAIVGLAVVAVRDQPPPQKPVAESSSTTGAPKRDTLLYRSDFTGDDWKEVDGPQLRAARLDAGFHVAIRGPDASWGMVTKGADALESRWSMSVAVDVTDAPRARLWMACGTRLAGFRFVTTAMGLDGSWQILLDENVIASGSAPSLAPELHERFVMRMDCLTDRNPSLIRLFVNDRLLGEADGPPPFPFVHGWLGTDAQGSEPYDLFISAFSISRLGQL